MRTFDCPAIVPAMVNHHVRRLALAVVLAFALAAGAIPQRIPTITGPSWVMIAVPIQRGVTPPVLKRTSSGLPVWLVQVIHDRALYAFRTSTGGQIGIEDTTHAPPTPIAFSPHPNLRPEDLVPEVHINGGAVRVYGKNAPIHDSPAVQRWRLTAHEGSVVVVLNVTLHAQSPIVYYDGWVSRRGRTAPLTERVQLGIRLGIPAYDRTTFYAQDRTPTVGQTVMRQCVETSVTVDLGTARVIRFTAAAPREGHDGDAQMVSAACDRGWWPVYGVMDGPLLGDEHPGARYDRVAVPDLMAPEHDANQPGNHQSLGGNCFAPLGSSHDDPVRVLVRSSDEWALRSCFLLSPTADRVCTIQDVVESDLYDRRLASAGQLPYPDNLPQWTTGIRRRANDEQHQDDHPLQVGYQLTGDPVLAEIILAQRIVDSHTRRVASGWTNSAPRGDGRWMRSVVRSAMLLGDPGDRAREAVAARIMAIQAEQDRFLAANQAASLRPWKYHSASQIAVYEYGQIAHGAWLAHAHFGTPGALQVAEEAAAVVCAYTWTADGRPWAPYRTELLPTSIPTNEALIGSASQQDATFEMEQGNPDWVFWCAPAYAVAVRTGLRSVPSSADLLQRATAAREWLTAQQPTSVILSNFIL